MNTNELLNNYFSQTTCQCENFYHTDGHKDSHQDSMNEYLHNDTHYDNHIDSNS